MKNDSKGRARTKIKQKATKIKSKCASNGPNAELGEGDDKESIYK